MLKEVSKSEYIGSTDECPNRIYGCDTCGITKNTCYRSSENGFPVNCPLRSVL